MTRFGVVVVAFVFAVFLVAGAGSPAAAVDACPTSNPPNELVLAGGSGQTAQLGQPFPAALQVQLANTNDCPLTGDLAGYDVDFAAPGSGPSGIFAGTGSHDAVVGTNAQGAATAPAFTANFGAGSYTVEAHSDFGSVELNLSNTAAGLAASIAATAGTPQAATVNGLYAQPLQARVADAAGNPVQGAIVSFSVVPGTTGAGASFLGGGQGTSTTDSNGVATSPPLQADETPGRFTAVASTGGVTVVATYNLDNHAAVAALGAVGATAQSATIDSRYPKPLTARLVDQSGRPVEGAAVTFTLGAANGGGGGAAAPGASFPGGTGQATVLTDANGEAATPLFLANDTPGEFTATATAVGATTPVTYTLRNLAARLAARGPVRSATVGRRYAHALSVRVSGAGGRPVVGAPVTFTIAAQGAADAGASFAGGESQAVVTTNSSGIATAPVMTANTVAGSFQATASLAGGSPIAFGLRNRAGSPATIATGAADGISTAVGSRFPIRLAVTVTDVDGNPVAGMPVRFLAPVHGPGGHFAARVHGRTGSVRTVRVRTNARGIAIAPPFTANSASGGYAVGVRAGSRQAAFALVNRP